jgi:hypothetical protein
MPATDLVVVPAGDRSLHIEFQDERQYDLWVVYYGDDEAVADGYARGCDRLIRRRGLKWEIVRAFGREHLTGEASPFEKYRYVLIPDDDLRFRDGAAAVNRLFEAAAAVRADIFQPAVNNGNWSIAWEPTRRVAGAFCHAVNIVECMAPGFAGPLFARVVLPALNALQFQRAGWGVEPIFALYGEMLFRRPMRSFVLDAVPVDHTRPVGTGATSHEIGADEAFITPMIYSNRMKEYARFAGADEALAFEFPFAADASDLGALNGHMAAVRGARMLWSQWSAMQRRG